MIVAAMYSFKRGREILEAEYAAGLAEIREIIDSVDAAAHKTSEEKTMPGRMLYSPPALNRAFEEEFARREWRHRERIVCEYSADYYTEGYASSPVGAGAFREMDFVKSRIGVEIQFGKYAFMVYNVCAKMTIFHNHDLIDVGVEIVPVKSMADNMSTGVSYFEQIVWDLEHRGVADIDIPVLIVGLDAE